MWTNKAFRNLVRAGVVKRHAYKRCSCCRLWVDNRNHQRHQRACKRNRKEDNEAE